jgi:hypothetical protein
MNYLPNFFTRKQPQPQPPQQYSHLDNESYFQNPYSDGSSPQTTKVPSFIEDRLREQRSEHQKEENRQNESQQILDSGREYGQKNFGDKSVFKNNPNNNLGFGLTNSDTIEYNDRTKYNNLLRGSVFKNPNLGQKPFGQQTGYNHRRPGLSKARTMAQQNRFTARMKNRLAARIARSRNASRGTTFYGGQQMQQQMQQTRSKQMLHNLSQRLSNAFGLRRQQMGGNKRSEKKKRKAKRKEEA